jgi:hypothetical protein
MIPLRALISFFVFFSCVVLTFKGFPWALGSFLGFLLEMGGWSGAVSAMFHPMGARIGRRLGTIVLGFAIASLGLAMTKWSGLYSIGLFSLEIPVGRLGAIIGLLSGLLNIDKNMIQQVTSPERQD